jgi:hypothetical protein
MKYNNFDQYNRIRPYKAQNMIVKILETEAPPETQPQPQPQPAEEIQQPLVSTGYINVGVYTALGALPVKDAVVTVYTIDEDGEENALYHVVSNINGRVPTMEVPVEYNPENPLESPSFYFSTYNMRIQAIGYYTVNIIDLRVFPEVATNYRVILIPVMEGATEEEGSQTVVIPPTPADISNE